MRVVIDTNVLVAALQGSRPAAQVVTWCLEGRLTPLIGGALFAEYEEVLARAQLFERASLSAEERAELFDIFLACCHWVRIYFGWRPNLPDEADNHLIELAVAGGATVIISRNLRDLTRGELIFPDLRIVPPETFVLEHDT